MWCSALGGVSRSASPKTTAADTIRANQAHMCPRLRTPWGLVGGPFATSVLYARLRLPLAKTWEATLASRSARTPTRRASASRCATPTALAMSLRAASSFASTQASTSDLWGARWGANPSSACLRTPLEGHPHRAFFCLSFSLLCLVLCCGRRRWQPGVVCHQRSRPRTHKVRRPGWRAVWRLWLVTLVVWPFLLVGGDACTQ